jgi:hypothetical protein
MNHKILNNQIMLSPAEGYLNPWPSLPLSWLSALSLFHQALKNLLARKKKKKKSWEAPAD